MTREGAGAEERLAEQIREMGDCWFCNKCGYVGSTGPMHGGGCSYYAGKVESNLDTGKVAAMIGYALNAASSAATAKERERCARLRDAVDTVCGRLWRENSPFARSIRDHLRAALGCEQDGAPQDEEG